jgi:hypothetical protein
MGEICSSYNISVQKTQGKMEDLGVDGRIM